MPNSSAAATVPRGCDISRTHFTNRRANSRVVGGSIFVSLVTGHLLLARWWLLVPYSAGALQALFWYWLLVIPKGTR